MFFNNSDCALDYDKKIKKRKLSVDYVDNYHHSALTQSTYSPSSLPSFIMVEDEENELSNFDLTNSLRK